MLRVFLRFLRSDEGVTAVEFSLFAAPLLFLLLGIVEYAIIFHMQSLATHAGNEAARMGKTGAQYCAIGVDKRTCIENEVKTIMGPWIRENRPLVTTVTSYGGFGSVGGSGNTGMGNSGDVVLYQLSILWKPITPFLFNGLKENGGITISAFALVKNEAF